MGNDMQFFLTSPFIIYALWRSRNRPWTRNVGIGLLGLLTIIFTAIPTILTAVNDFPFSPMLMNGADPVNAQGKYMMEFYIVPWCRWLSSNTCLKGWLAIAKLKPLSLFIPLF